METATDDSRPLYSFLFDVGDSVRGPIGASFRVTAHTPQEAVQILRTELAAYEDGAKLGDLPDMNEEPLWHAPGIDYAEIFLTLAGIGIEQITSVDDGYGHEVDWQTLFSTTSE